jgi:hypothetical protein
VKNEGKKQKNTYEIHLEARIGHFHTPSLEKGKVR